MLDPASMDVLEFGSMRRDLQEQMRSLIFTPGAERRQA